ncbi:hypothetical protein WG906_14770 [Pedobacter sp. P351]|uniref:hypothetical protein n=1 Tax=Pedobacter superstes TaxID=3133441 RepID=UPI00309ACC55
MKSEEMDERLSDTESVLSLHEKRIMKLEQEKTEQPVINIPDYSQEFKSIKQTLLLSQNAGDLVQIKQTLANISAHIENEPKHTVKSYRLLLFPETNAGTYYRIVFGRLIPWGMVFVAIACLFSLCQQSIKAWEAYQYNKRAERCVRAWVYMDEHATKQVKKAMEKAWLKSAKEP